MSTPISVVQLRRYPVKAMAGERLREVEIDARGLAGDRGFAVVTEDGRFAAGKDTRRFRRMDGVFEYAARTLPDRIEVSGRGGVWRVGEPALDTALTALVQAPVRVLPENGVSHFDDSPVSLIGTATLEWVRRELRMDGDFRRLRANLLLETEEPFVEESWLGRSLRIGAVELRVTKPVTRCRVVNMAQDGVAEHQRLLKALAPRDRKIAMYAEVVTPGVVREGDVVEVA